MTTSDAELLKLSPGRRAHLRIYMSNAKARKIKFDLAAADASALFDQDCYYCGAPPETRRFSIANKKPYIEKLNGLDRMNPAGNYTAANTVPCCKACNRGKAQLGHDDFLEMARRVAKKHP